MTNADLVLFHCFTSSRCSESVLTHVGGRGILLIAVDYIPFISIDIH